MKSLYHKLCILIISMSFLMVSCSADTSAEVAPTSTNSIADINSLLAEETKEKSTVGRIVKIGYGNIYNSRTLYTSMSYVGARHLSFEYDGVIKQIYAVSNKPVKKGDLLAVLELDKDQLERDMKILKSDYDYLSKSYVSKKIELEESLIVLEQSIYQSTDQYENEINSLKLKKAQLILSNYIKTQEEKLTELSGKMLELSEKANGVKLLAPADGYIVTGITISSDFPNRIIPANTPILTFAEDKNIYLSVNMDKKFIRFGETFKARVSDVTGVEPAAGSINAGDDGSGQAADEKEPISSTLELEVVSYVPGYLNMPAKVEMLMRISNGEVAFDKLSSLNAGFDYYVSKVENVLLVPIQAVYDIDDLHYVFVKENDEFIQRFIEIGILYNSSHFQIISGLNAGEEVKMK